MENKHKHVCTSTQVQKIEIVTCIYTPGIIFYVYAHSYKQDFLPFI